MSPAVVVKFGGSLLASPERDRLLAAAARHGAVVAPGGGAFADLVRGEQTRLGLSDGAAHAMATLAMDQTAFALADRAPDLALCASPEEFAAARDAGRGAIWRPSPMALKADLPASWDVTSDSLAVWLATALGAERLVVLKAASAPSTGGSSDWVAAGLIDRFFPGIAKGFSGEIALLGAATADALDRALTAPLRRAA